MYSFYCRCMFALDKTWNRMMAFFKELKAKNAKIQTFKCDFLVYMDFLMLI